MNDKTNIEKRVDPVGAVDVAVCRNGVVFLSGWLYWSEDKPRAQQVYLRTQVPTTDGAEAELLPLSVIPRVRAEVNEYLGIGPELLCGFSGRTHMSGFTQEALPTGPADVIALDPQDEFDPIKIGEIAIRWPDAPFQVPDQSESDAGFDLPAEPEAPVIKPQGFFDRLWNGRQAYEQNVLKTIGADDAMTVDAMLKVLSRTDRKTRKSAAIAPSSVAMLAHRIKSASDSGGLIVIFDHNYGGGANTFSQKLAASHTKAGNGVLRIWHTVSDGAYHGQYVTASEATDFEIDGANNLFRFLSRIPSFAVQINSIWTYPETRQFLDNVLRLRLYGFTQRLEFFAHDHMAVCPSLFLINHKGAFCGVPEDLKTCTTCLSRNMQDFKSYYPTTDIAGWRTSWQSLLVNADLIRFFSDSTLKNYTDAYPWLAENVNVIVEPHEVKDIWPRHYSRDKAMAKKSRSEGLKIGVFGYISEHKGSHVLKAMSDAIMKKSDPTRIQVYGSLEGKTHGRMGAIEMMGTYAPADLVDICEDNGIDVAFVPSICPETFSFITKELTLIGIPVVSFDLGGQSDIVKAYDKGHVFKMGTGLSLLKQFKALEKSL